MVGALADWFAVTALFRHPLGLPIPHTNIIQTRQAEIGAGLADFISSNFLTQANIERYLADVDLADSLGRRLKDEKLTRELSVTLCSALRAVVDNDNGELEAFMSRTLREALDRLPVHRLVAWVLNRLINNDQTQVLIGMFVKWGHEYFEDNRARLRENVRAEATFGTKTIAVRAFDRLATSLRDVLSEMHTNPTARRGFDQRLKALARDFENDEDTIKRTEAFKHKLLTAPEATTFFAHTWEECKRALVRILRGTPTQDPALARDVAKLLDRLGDMVREDPFIHQMIDERLKAALPALVERYRHDVSTKIRETVIGWDKQETANRIELYIGRDLQCMRINGTLVGGVVGLLIYSLSHGLF